jgi:AcrR family transcriptional regulator
MSTNMKSVIAANFFALVQERGFDKITVKDLVERCHISRQTFYYHFQDLLDVVEWSAQRGIQRAVNLTAEIYDTEQVLQRVVEIARENWQIVEGLMKSQKREYLERIFANTLRDYVLELVAKNAPGMTFNYDDTVVAIQFYAHGIAGVLMEQCGKPDCDTKRLASQLLGLIQGRTFESK